METIQYSIGGLPAFLLYLISQHRLIQGLAGSSALLFPAYKIFK